MLPPLYESAVERPNANHVTVGAAATDVKCEKQSFFSGALTLNGH